MCQCEGTHKTATSFSPPVAGCLLKKNRTKGGGSTGTPGPPIGNAPERGSLSPQKKTQFSAPIRFDYFVIVLLMGNYNTIQFFFDTEYLNPSYHLTFSQGKYQRK